MTNTEIKTEVDLKITDVIEVGGVDNIEVGNIIKSLVDYTDQEVATVTVSAIPEIVVGLGQAPGGGILFPSVKYDTFSLGVFDIDPSNVRDVLFTRTGVGTFEIHIRHMGTGIIVDTTKQLDIKFPDNKYRFLGVTSQGATTPGPHNFIKMAFETYNNSFVVSDNEMLDSYAERITIKLYPAI